MGTTARVISKGDASRELRAINSTLDRILDEKGADLDHTEFLREKPRDLKTVLGIFYTPAPLAEALVDWAVKDKNQRVLEPSFGGCGFLNAIARRLTELGQDRPWQQIYGCDKDYRAFRFLPKQYQQLNRSAQFRLGDFLGFEPKDFGSDGFDVVLGNPPYVSRQTMTGKQIISAELALKKEGKRLSSRSSLWAYFVLHSLKFLRVNGRIAWVLPRSLSQSHYGRDLLKILRTKFSAVLVISLEQRMFTDSGTEEITDVLLATGFNANSPLLGDIAHVHAKSLADLRQILATDRLQQKSIAEGFLESSGRGVILSVENRKALNEVYALSCCRLLSDLFDIKIGLVTGASDFFILKKADLENKGLRPIDCDVIIAKYRNTKGLEITPKDVDALRASDDRILLIKCSGDDIESKVRDYLNTFPKDLRGKVETFKKRTPWHSLDDKQIPEAFLPCLIMDSPRLVVNRARLNCTNNLLRVWFKKDSSKLLPELFAISLASTMGQVTAEIFGRACGSGGLKIEPSDWKKMKLILPEVNDSGELLLAFSEINKLIRSGNVMAARKRADQFLIQTIPDFKKIAFTVMPKLEAALIELQNTRK